MEATTSAPAHDLVRDRLTDLYIGGQPVPASNGGRFDVVDPATGSVVASVANGTVEDAIAAVDAAQDAAAAWAATPPRGRGEILRRGFELMTGQAEDLARLITLKNGKALAYARGEVGYAAEFFRWYAEEAVRASGEIVTAPSGANKILVLHQPSRARWSPRCATGARPAPRRTGSTSKLRSPRSSVAGWPSGCPR
jgi:succinate-semialdehyde dehydrogenase/glutarate-semialdehyde dehydrogenase